MLLNVLANMITWRPGVSQVSQEEMGVVKSYNLKPGGDKIAVTKHNRKGVVLHSHYY